MRDFAHIAGYLYSVLRWRLLVWLLLIVLASALEGVTLGLFLPIIAGSESDAPLQQLFTSAFDRFGISYTLPLALGAMAGIYAFRTALVVLQELYVARVIAGLIVEIKSRVFDQLLRADYQYFTNRGVGYFNNAVTVEFTNLTHAFNYCTQTVVAAAFTVTYVVLAMVISPMLAIALAIFGVPAYFLLRAAFRMVQRVSLSNTENNSILQSHLIQALGGFKYFKATASIGGISGAVSSAIGEQGRLMFAQRRLAALVKNSIDLLTVLLIVALLLYYVEVVGTAFVEMVFVLVILRRTVTFAQNTQRSFQQFLDFSGSVRLFRSLSDELSENTEVFDSASVAPNFDLPIRLDNVTFGYDGSPPILEGVSLVIPPRTKVALVGASGAGKTTLATILTGILHPTSGVVSIGGVPYDRVDQARLREGIGYVTQENVIFNDTVRNNVSLWDEGDPGRVTSAARAARASEFIEDLPDGYDTLLGDSGTRISGGQRQRIAIARELYKNARVLILDEGTGALDSESEQAIQENIDRLRENSTLILIAHRLSTVRNSDMIFVLDAGQIVEQGTYEYLYASCGRFTKMVDQQALGNEHYGDSPVTSASDMFNGVSPPVRPDPRRAPGNELVEGCG